MNKTPLLFRSANWRRRFRRRLLGWYDRHARDLPWRRSRDAYRVWVSEIMLQQTQVATVKPYFERFIESFPSVKVFARAEEEHVLRHWEGLGYYRRARQMHRAAQKIVEEHGGVFPRDPEAVRALPGIGRYTAGAILSIAFDLRQPILEANTVRLFSRLLAYRGDPLASAGQQLLWRAAECVLPRKEVGRFNQALMELGSEVCRGRAPRCDVCPVAPLCEAKTRGLQGELPPAKAKRPPELRHEAALVVRRRGRVLLLRQPDGGRWAGLWDFPRFEVHAENPDNLRQELIDKVREATGLVVAPGQRLKTIKHGVTRFRITLDCYEADYISGKLGSQETLLKWFRPAELAELPLSTTGRKLSRLINGEEMNSEMNRTRRAGGR